MKRTGRGIGIALATVACLLPMRAEAQVGDSIPGVELGILYEADEPPILAVQPFTGRVGGETTAPEVEAIMAQDLRYSNRFEVLDALPPDLVPDEVDYQIWEQLNATWLLSGRLEGAGDGYALLIEVHDVVFQEVRHRGRFPVPPPASDDFRMAVHLASDQVVQWVFGEPGIAATRIAFARRDADFNSHIYVIDSDGANLRRITRGEVLSKGPSWDPTGQRVVYAKHTGEAWRIFELDVESGEERELPIDREGDHITPVFSPTRGEIAFSITGGGRTGLYKYNLDRDCCLQYISGGNWEDVSPTYSPRGDELAFMSNRIAGPPHPQIYTMPATGGEANLLSPYEFGPSAGYYTSPEWSPDGRHVAFHGRVTRRGFHQILVADIDVGQRGLRQLTSEGNNEDPSWAPDGRHIAFVGRRNWGTGLMIVDSATGKIRMLLRGVDVTVPSWSPSLEGRLQESLGGGSF